MAQQWPPAGDAIEIRIEDIAQLFESLDPFPFREKDLNKEAEEFIVSWARELPLNQPLTIVVHIPKTQASSLEAPELGAVVNRYFLYRAQVISLDLNELFRVGWRALAIDLTVLSICVVGGQIAATHLSPLPVSRVVQESLTIFGWVANWKPIQIFLYDWWPIVRRRSLYERLSEAKVKVKLYETGQMQGFANG